MTRRVASYARNDDVRRSPPIPTKTFTAFLFSDAYARSRWQVVDEVAARMVLADIKSRAQLLRFVAEAYPEQFERYHYLQEVTGRQATIRLWSDFLRWADGF